MSKTPQQVIEERYAAHVAAQGRRAAALGRVLSQYRQALTIIAGCAKAPHKLSTGIGQTVCKPDCPTCAAIQFLKGYDL